MKGLFMTDERLIEKAAKAIFAEEQCDSKQKRNADSINENWDNRLGDADKGEYRSFARAALAVFEKAHTPTDDERGDRSRLITIINEIQSHDPFVISDAVLAAGFGFRRSEPQGEPSDAPEKVTAALYAYWGSAGGGTWSRSQREAMGRALRAASEVGGEGR